MSYIPQRVVAKIKVKKTNRAKNIAVTVDHKDSRKLFDLLSGLLTGEYKLESVLSYDDLDHEER